MLNKTQVRAAKQKVVQILKGSHDIQGVGITWMDDGTPSIIVNVSPGHRNRVKSLLPPEIDHVHVQIDEMKPIHVLDKK